MDNAKDIAKSGSAQEYASFRKRAGVRKLQGTWGEDHDVKR